MRKVLYFVLLVSLCNGLIVPPTSPTRHQLISGIGIPLDLEDEAITLGLVMKAQYFLPENVNHLKWIYFPGIFGNYTPTNFATTAWQQFPNGKRRRREIMTDDMTGMKYEKFTEEAEVIRNTELIENDQYDQYDEDEDNFDDQFPEDELLTKREDFPTPTEEEQNDNSASRWLIYDGFAKLLSSKGFNGRICVLRGICEAAQAKFSHHSGLLSELLHIVFTPSSTVDPVLKSDHYDYLKAEQLGNNDEPCNEIFFQCKKSVLDIFTQVYDSDLFKF
ncbi:unnamed protein product [Diamesa tonsa]